MVRFIKTHKAYVTGLLFFVATSAWLFLHVGGVRPHCDIDSGAYLERARLLLTTGSFRNPASPDLPYYALGYPLFIALIQAVSRAGAGAVVLAQLLLAILNLFIIRNMTRRLFNRRAGLFAFLFAACSLGYLVFAQFVLTELLLATLLTGCFALLFAPQTWQRSLGAGFLLGLSVIVKPAALYCLMPLAVLWFFWHQRLALALIFGFALPVGGMLAHNVVVFGQCSLGALSSINLCYWFYPYLLAQEHGTTAEQERGKLMARTGGIYQPALIKPYLIADVSRWPYRAAWCWFTNMAKTLGGLYTTNLKVLTGAVRGGDVSFWKQEGRSVWIRMRGYLTAGAAAGWVVGVGIAEACMNVVRYCLVAVGLVALWRRPARSECILAMLLLGYFVAITGHDGCARFRMLIESLLISPWLQEGLMHG